MAKVYDVPQQEFISRLTEILKNEDIPAPVWASFVKTGSHADKARCVLLVTVTLRSIKYTASIKPLNKDIGISVDFSQFNAGPIESPWENQDQFVVGLEMLWGKNLKCFAEYIRTDGYVPLNFISGPDPSDPNKALGTTHSSSETKSNVFLVGLRMAI